MIPCGLWRAGKPTAATSIQNNSGLRQGPADLPLAGSTCGKPAVRRGPLAGMIDGRHGEGRDWPFDENGNDPDGWTAQIVVTITRP